MKNTGLLMAIFISIVFLATMGYGQTTDAEKAAEKIKAQQVTQGKESAADVKNRTVPKTSRPNPVSSRPKDVPEVPLTNARIAYDYTSFDFGLVPPGAQITHHFPVHNTGPDTLIITKIKAG